MLKSKDIHVKMSDINSLKSKSSQPLKIPKQ